MKNSWQINKSVVQYKYKERMEVMIMLNWEYEEHYEELVAVAQEWLEQESE